MAIATGMLLVPICLDPLCRMSSSAQGIYSLISNISSFTTYPDIIFELKKMDIETSVRVLEKCLKELKVKNKTATMDEIVFSLKECIIEIEQQLSIIHEKMAFNQTVKYFQYFRTFKLYEYINNLKILNEQLKNRKQLFFEVVAANNNLEKDNEKINIDLDMSLL